jgi:hypothetical protein
MKKLMTFIALLWCITSIHSGLLASSAPPNIHPRPLVFYHRRTGGAPFRGLAQLTWSHSHLAPRYKASIQQPEITSTEKLLTHMNNSDEKSPSQNKPVPQFNSVSELFTYLAALPKNDSVVAVGDLKKNAYRNALKKEEKQARKVARLHKKRIIKNNKMS